MHLMQSVFSEAALSRLCCLLQFAITSKWHGKSFSGWAAASDSMAWEERKENGVKKVFFSFTPSVKEY